MTALNNTYRIQNYDSIPKNKLNDQFGLDDDFVIFVDRFQSTLIKDAEDISFSNRLEIQKVKEFAQLERNWDSYDAKEISLSVINKSINLIEEINRFEEDIYFSSPGPNGEVMIQQKKNAKEVEFIIYTSKSKYVTFNNNEFEKQGEFSLYILPELIEWININI